jgi:Phosphate-selective porin O and P
MRAPREKDSMPSLPQRTSRFTALKAALAGAALMTTAAGVEAADVSLGAGLRTSFVNNDADDSSDFQINNLRLFLGGSVTDTIKFTVNTEYSSDNDLQLMDAIARFEFSDEFNIWAGRFLPPSDRSNLYGNFYANNWGVYQDGVQDGWPMIAVGRDNGLMYWGQFGRVKVSAGAFDVNSTLGDSEVVAAGRLMVDFWDIEKGYYLNGTYYGGKDILAVGVAAQSADSETSVSGDFLLEKKLASAGVINVEAEYAQYKGIAGYGYFPFTKSDGYYGLVSYLFPQTAGIGKFQVLAKYGETDYDATVDYTQKTTEFDVNYVIKDFNARLMLFFIDTSFTGTRSADDFKQIGLGLQVQM